MIFDIYMLTMLYYVGGFMGIPRKNSNDFYGLEWGIIGIYSIRRASSEMAKFEE